MSQLESTKFPWILGPLQENPNVFYDHNCVSAKESWKVYQVPASDMISVLISKKNGGGDNQAELAYKHDALE